nr:uncharacterized protein LOC116650433 [Drosophila virilis]
MRGRGSVYPFSMADQAQATLMTATPPPPVAVSLRPRCDDASVLLFKQKTKNICALGFDEFLALTDIDDNDDTQTRPSTRCRKHFKLNSRALFLTPWLLHVQASAAGYKLRHVLLGCIIIYAPFRKCPKPRYIATIPRSLTLGILATIIHKNFS